MIIKTTIKDIQSVIDFVEQYKEDSPKFAGIDTETTGLNVIKDKPFLIIFGYYVNESYKTWLIDRRDVDKEVWDTTLFAIKNLFKLADYVVGHQLKFDLHMLHNIGFAEMFTNVSDSQILIRLTHDSKVVNEGGVPMDLSGYANRYLDKNAKTYQRKIRSTLTTLKREQTRDLLEELQKFPIPEKYGNRKWTRTLVTELTKDKITTYDDLPEDIANTIKKYNKDISWEEVPRHLIHEYAHMDVVYTLMIFVKRFHLIDRYELQDVFQRENNLIIPLYKSERLGFPFNKEYAIQAEQRLKQFILELREELNEVAGQEITVGQHTTIKDIITNKFNLPIGSTGKSALEDIRTDNPDLKRFIELILKLRTLEKWYSTYLVGYIETEYEGRIRTSFHQAGTVTGRLSSSFQQFPRRGIEHEGELIFHPRRLVKVNVESDYNRLLYIDYSQIELRVQALYTLLISGGDLNLCRAYMPFKCIDENGNHYINGKPFEHKTWYYEEDPTVEWKPTDVHAKTAELAFGDKIYEDFDHYRSLGKTTNFASNYGSGVGGIHMALKGSTELAERMYKAYNEAFPQIYDYRRYVQRLLVLDNGARNLFGRLYFGSSAHKISNYLIQGSAADIIKMKIIEVDNYIKEKGYKSRILMNIHDEIQFELHKDEPDSIAYEFKAIMEDLGNLPIPIVADIEISYTSWDEAGDLDDSN